MFLAEKINDLKTERNKLLLDAAEDLRGIVNASSIVDGPGRVKMEFLVRFIQRIDPKSGATLERLEMPRGVGVSGMESDGADLFYCGGGPSGKVRAVRRPKT